MIYLVLTEDCYGGFMSDPDGKHLGRVFVSQGEAQNYAESLNQTDSVIKEFDLQMNPGSKVWLGLSENFYGGPISHIQARASEFQICPSDLQAQNTDFEVVEVTVN